MPIKKNQKSFSVFSYLNVSINVEPVILGSKYNRSILHESHIEALGMLDLALQSPQELSCLAEHGQIEVVVVVRDADLS